MANRYPQFAPHQRGDYPGLIESPFPLFIGVQRHRHDNVRPGNLLRLQLRGQQAAQAEQQLRPFSAFALQDQLVYGELIEEGGKALVIVRLLLDALLAKPFKWVRPGLGTALTAVLRSLPDWRR